jgi:hypothetical protein
VAAGVAVGVVAGAAVASTNSNAAASNAYAAGVATGANVASANNASATANVYNAGVVAGATASYSMGEIVATAPSGCGRRMWAAIHIICVGTPG